VTRLGFRVHGTPAPQGSKRHVGNGIMVESSNRVKPWRQDVKHAALGKRRVGHRQDSTPTMAGPVLLNVVFYMKRPRAHYRTGKLSHLLRDDAPTMHSSRPDVDKLLRSTMDALGEAGVWRDDSQVANVSATKVYDDHPGAFITVEDVTRVI
jgi:Holliday junction resolvase RusA-like endonuclease